MRVVVGPYAPLSLLGLSYLSLVLALSFTLYGLALVPHPFPWLSLVLFDAFMILLAGVGWLLFEMEARSLGF